MNNIASNQSRLKKHPLEAKEDTRSGKEEKANKHKKFHST